ncbi:hypothetical protein [Variovorax paradoxus]|uniref:hypothetical protein n=1 Tax=Variovorax paradoxus TaxID=34073 RepID=UPI003D6476AE
MKTFDLYARVYVAASGGWKATFLGTICSEAEPVQTVKGPENYYWVEFDESQEDVSGPDLYRKAQILSCYLESV